MFMEFWKRKQATLAWEWNLADLDYGMTPEYLTLKSLTTPFLASLSTNDIGSSDRNGRSLVNFVRDMPAPTDGQQLITGGLRLFFPFLVGLL
ncbi:hypothetical protein TNIN_488521 [Trichonephila inaurata madagascariensis]|uniref:Uncharacterized protein n=1 Tax=Trichonephila inaurata madagascariensis TaxID=2747483 RepID=A0A8X6XAF8_9ARAC|nr:hypothetical protein TNIN_488521 [Trichonephila inaurata madagascariensis]